MSIQSNKLSKLAHFWCCKWIWGYSWTWATDESSFLIINSVMFLSGLWCLRQTSKRGAYKVYTDKDRYSTGKYANCRGLAASIRAWKKTYPNLKAPCVNFKNITKLNLKKQAPKTYHPKKSQLKRCVDARYLVIN